MSNGGADWTRASELNRQIVALRLEAERRGGRFWREDEAFYPVVLYESKKLYPSFWRAWIRGGGKDLAGTLPELGLGVIRFPPRIRFNFIELAAPVRHGD